MDEIDNRFPRVLSSKRWDVQRHRRQCRGHERSWSPRVATVVKGARRAVIWSKDDEATCTSCDRSPPGRLGVHGRRGGASKSGHGRRPFFIIGHMANTIAEVDQFLGEGANSVEVDIEFARNGTVLGTHHELFPCECFRVCGKRTSIKKFLTHIREITAHPSSRYAGKMILLFLDLKTSKVPAEYKLTAGRTLAESLVTYLWNDVTQNRTMNVLISIGYINDQDVLKGAIKYLSQDKYLHLQKKIGFDVGMNAPLHDIRRMYEKMGITHHRWQGDGLMNCFRFLIPHNRLKEAIQERDTPGGYIDKVYYWTVDLPENIAKAIRS
ncbi:hypothetical protein HPB52_002411 [Rhipicephalus sanguineus]|uniref:Sphingomyelinase n=1 Tax=Rhipicephalus sanguineus TaxID=34632 RepID=A0A9D4PPQ8_RHISA|nr:hypothetical protein HPB52_002411 [Rhipicephalus sanguineus]